VTIIAYMFCDKITRGVECQRVVELATEPLKGQVITLNYPNKDYVKENKAERWVTGYDVLDVLPGIGPNEYLVAIGPKKIYNESEAETNLFFNHGSPVTHEYGPRS
jgi:hypothetical protein